jgi:hypothetical protein
MCINLSINPIGKTTLIEFFLGKKKLTATRREIYRKDK